MSRPDVASIAPAMPSASFLWMDVCRVVWPVHAEPVHLTACRSSFPSIVSAMSSFPDALIGTSRAQCTSLVERGMSTWSPSVPLITVRDCIFWGGL